MTPLTTQHHQNWKCIVRAFDNIYVSSKSGPLPQPAAGHARIRLAAASVCGADMRIARGDKDAHGNSASGVTMGHEGCGVIDAIGEGSPSRLRVGDFVVVLPHIHVSPERAGGCTRSTSQIVAACTSRHHTDHAGWDFPGVFSDIGVFPLENLVLVQPEQLARAEQLAPDLGRRLFTITEPMLCCYSAYDLMEREVQFLRNRGLGEGRALVVGCGPIGIMHGIILSERGFHVSFFDTVPQRAALARRCLGGGDLYNPADPSYDVVIVTANVKPAIELAEAAVKDDGIIYLFAGMNADDRQATHPDGVFSYEKVHRLAQGVLTWTKGKRILYLGHSGYNASLAPMVIAMVSANAARLDQLITGAITGWDNSTIASRIPGGKDWTASDGSAAILSVLGGRADLRDHGKLVIIPQMDNLEVARP